MSLERKKLGADTEFLAAQFLNEKGFKVVERNFRCSIGEIDLIALDVQTLVFVEVKSRRSLRFGAPSQAVNWQKQKRLFRLAQWYLKLKKIQDKPCRFDVVSVYAPDEGKPQIKHIPNAFRF